ncbi:MAG TPA: T9SS type A sorting domain-containing protein, partial [Prolixibacteraceae bacterium]|nr:T9SS type A sorting domain-containing protein [Prolixibacteraceae bacterium]
SDHNTFQDANIPAILLIDGNPWFGEINPHIHSSADTIGASANSPELAEKITKAGLATLLDTDQKGFRGQAPVYKLPLSFRAFPNPVSVFLTVEMQKSFPGSGPLCLYNSMGQLLQLWNGGKRTLQIDFSVYPEGLYLLQKEGEWVKVMKR